MQIANLYLDSEKILAELETTVDTETFENKCKETEKICRRQIKKIDASAIEDADGLWSFMFEEMGNGIC